MPTVTAFPTSTYAPFGVSVGPDSNMWIGTNNAGVILKFTTGGSYTPYSLSGAGNTQPTLSCIGPDSNLWFVVPDGTGNTDVTRINVSTGASVVSYKLSGAFGTGICTGSDNNLWVSDGNGRVWKITTGGSTAYYTLTSSINNAICPGPDGNLWLADGGNGGVWKVTTGGSGTFYALSGSMPNGICVGADNNLWVADVNTAIWKVATGGSNTSYALTGSYPSYNCLGADGNVWVADGNGAVWSVTTSGVGTSNALVYMGTPANAIQPCVGPDSNIWVTDGNNDVMWQVVTSGGPFAQTYPLGNTVSHNNSLTFTTQLETVNGTGADTWTTIVPTSALTVSSSGSVVTTGYLPIGTYTASGSVMDTASHSALWSYSLAVTDLQMPTISFEVAFNGPSNLPLTSGITWTEVYPFVRSFSTTLGRQHELDEIQASTLTAELDNRSGVFNPWASAASVILPFSAVRVQATWDGVTYPIFYGYINSVTAKSPDFTNSDVTLQATDLLGYLALQELNSTGVAAGYDGASVAPNGLYAQKVFGSSGGPPQAYYTFGSPPNANYNPPPAWALDYSGNGYNASGSVISGGASVIGSVVTSGVQGPLLYDTSTAVNFADGSSTPNPAGYAHIPLAAVAGSGGWGIEFWTQIPQKASSAGTNGEMFAFMTSNGADYAAITLNVAPSVKAIRWESGPLTGPTSVASIGPITFNDGNWHQIAVTGSARSSASVNIYMDGQWRTAASIALTNPNVTSASALYNQAVIGGRYVTNFTSVATWLPSYCGSMAQWAFYDYQPTDQDIEVHYAAGSYFARDVESGFRMNECLQVAAIPTNLYTSGSVVGTASVQAETSPVTGTAALSYMVSIQQTEDGLLFVNPSGVVTFYNRLYVIENPTPQVGISDISASTFVDPATMATVNNINYEPNPLIVRDDLDLWPVISITRQNGITQTAASVQIADFGSRIGPAGGLNGLLFTNDGDSLTLAKWLLQRYANSQPRVMSVALSSTSNGGLNLPYMLGLSLWDVVCFQRAKAPGQTTVFIQDNVIESITHNVQPDQWVTTWVLSPYELLNVA